MSEREPLERFQVYADILLVAVNVRLYDVKPRWAGISLGSRGRPALKHNGESLNTSSLRSRRRFPPEAHAFTVPLHQYSNSNPLLQLSQCCYSWVRHEVCGEGEILCKHVAYLTGLTCPIAVRRASEMEELEPVNMAESERGRCQ